MELRITNSGIDGIAAKMASIFSRTFGLVSFCAEPTYARARGKSRRLPRWVLVPCAFDPTEKNIPEQGMKSRFLASLALAFTTVLATSCITALGCASCETTQSVVDHVAKAHPEVARPSVHST